jgi:hypothetical protein
MHGIASVGCKSCNVSSESAVLWRQECSSSPESDPRGRERRRQIEDIVMGVSWPVACRTVQSMDSCCTAVSASGLATEIPTWFSAIANSVTHRGSRQ